ncbi:peptidase E [Chitinimonas arctica]|uniref:Peptidase E n=1 Tax=Chitinimonas arctica TaxID=2594795 RepID=A0A516SI43_9NEIS|nr:peptidase E [Chitinimonas arctica]QDQ27805.1 peptidase E [Chitinimonas arctica]
MSKQLIVQGGGGFSMETTPLLDQHFLAATRKAKPRICFLPTASGDPDGYLFKFYSAHARYDCHASHLSLFRPHTADLAGFLLEQDAIYVGGGNTKSMLALWRDWGVDRILADAYAAGIVMGGVSAGMICWFEQGLTDSIPGPLSALPCLGWLAGGACPHYDGEAQRRPRLRQVVGDGAMLDSWAADDGAALHFVDGQLNEAVCSRPGAQAWRVQRQADGSVLETPLPTRYLGEA